jgi:hypothetical protein
MLIATLTITLYKQKIHRQGGIQRGRSNDNPKKKLTKDNLITFFLTPFDQGIF